MKGNNMKKYLIITAIVMFVFSNSNVTFAENPDAKSPVGVVMKVVRNVEYKTGDKSWAEAKVGNPVYTEDEIKTGPKSLVVIKFNDNSTLNVKENSSVKLYADKNKRELSKNTYVEKGKLGFNVTKQQNEEFKFTTPTMVASIRGTNGELNVDDQGESSIGLGAGIVEITNINGTQNLTLVAGQQAFVNKDGEINVTEMNEEQTQGINTRNTSTPKKIIIKTDKGTIEIEYFD